MNRWDVFVDDLGDPDFLPENSRGAWCKWEDVAPLLERVKELEAKLKAEIERLEGELKEMNRLRQVALDLNSDSYKWGKRLEAELAEAREELERARQYMLRVNL